MEKHAGPKVKCKSDRTTGMEMQSLQEWQNLVISSLQFLCGEMDPANLQECLTDGALDDEKMCRMVSQEGPFGNCVQREGATIDEVIISLIRYHRQDFKKDARCWRHKSSIKQQRRRSIPSLQELMNMSTASIVQERGRQARAEEQMVVCNPQVAATPPHYTEFPPTPTLSTEDLNHQMEGIEQRPSPLPYSAQYPPSWMPSNKGFSNLATAVQDGYRSDGSDGHSDDDGEQVVKTLKLQRRGSGSLVSAQREAEPITEDNLIGTYERLRYSRYAQGLPRVEELPSEVGLRRTVSERLLGSNRQQYAAGMNNLGYTVTAPQTEDDVVGLENMLPRIPGAGRTDENLRSLNSNKNSSNRSYPENTSPLGLSTQRLRDTSILGDRTPLGQLNMARAASSDDEENDEDLYE